MTDDDSDANTLMKKVDKELTSIKHISFGKVQTGGRKGTNHEMKMLAAEKDGLAIDLDTENNDFEAMEKALHECLIKKNRGKIL